MINIINFENINLETIKGDDFSKQFLELVSNNTINNDFILYKKTILNKDINNFITNFNTHKFYFSNYYDNQILNLKIHKEMEYALLISFKENFISIIEDNEFEGNKIEYVLNKILGLSLTLFKQIEKTSNKINIDWLFLRGYSLFSIANKLSNQLEIKPKTFEQIEITSSIIINNIYKNKPFLKEINNENMIYNIERKFVEIIHTYINKNIHKKELVIENNIETDYNQTFSFT